MEILVLGGTGAMGVPVVKILADRNNRVIVTTRQNKKSENKNIQFVQGDAHDLNFVRKLLENTYDAVIDFMIYTPNEFITFSKLYLEKTKQYVFLSSARVYADSPEVRITEDTPRLLDATKDTQYLATNEYALAKAREENVLTKSGDNNFTIIRPYITYYNNRLQLGIFEKEIWLQRALNGKKIVFSRNIASKYTTLTYGYDVALRIADLVGKDCALGKVYHIMTEECIIWEDVLECYLDVLEQRTGERPEVCWTEKSDSNLEKTNYYQIHCDREYNRRFSNVKIQTDSGEQQAFMETRQGLKKCLTEFLNGERRFQFRDWKEEAVLDRISGDKSSLKAIHGMKNKIKYFVYRYIFNV